MTLVHLPEKEKSYKLLNFNGNTIKNSNANIVKIDTPQQQRLFKFFVSNIYLYLGPDHAQITKVFWRLGSEFENFPVNNQKYLTIQFTCSESSALSKVNIKQ